MTTSAVRLAAPPDLGQPETDEDLLISKITPPPPPAWLVPRRRISTLISAGTRGPLTVISGPPGAGKTTAIASWAAGQQAATPVAWLSVDSYDNRPGSFWRYVTEAIRRAGVAVRPGDPAHAQDGTAGHLLLRLASTLAARSAPVVLVLDDIHLLTNRRQLSDLSYLLRNTAGRLRVVLACRTVPLLPLQRFRITGELTEIQAAELAFTVPEAGLLMTQHDIRLSGPELVRLTGRMAGWAAGLRLAAVSVRGQRDPDQQAREFNVQDSGVLDYLQDEALLPRSARDLDMLLRTCLPGYVCGDLAAELTGDRRAGERLRTLAAANAFIQPLGHGWYRYHPLFAEALRSKLRQRSGCDEVRDLHRRAARWFRRSGKLGDAVREAAAAGDWALAAWAVVEEQAIEPLMDPRTAEPLAHAFQGMPPSCGSTDPSCLLVNAALAVREHRTGTGRALLRAADSALGRLPAGQQVTSRLAAAQLRLSLARRAGELHRAEQAAADGETLLAGLPGDWVTQHPKARASTLAARGEVELWRGRFDTAAAALHAGAACDEATGAGRAGHAALVEAVRGRPDQAAELAAAELSPVDGQSGMAASAAAASVALAWVHLHRGQLDQSRTQLARAQDALRAVPDKLVAALAYLVAARHSLATGQPGLAIQMIERARTGWSPPPWLAHRLTLAESRARAAASQAGVPGGPARGATARPGPAAPAPSARPEPVIVGQLSEREREVLRRAATVLSTAEIAQELYLSANTVKSHLRSSYRKLGVSRRGEAIRRAQRLQLLLAHFAGLPAQLGEASDAPPPHMLMLRPPRPGRRCRPWTAGVFISHRAVPRRHPKRLLAHVKQWRSVALSKRGIKRPSSRARATAASRPETPSLR